MVISFIVFKNKFAFTTFIFGFKEKDEKEKKRLAIDWCLIDWFEGLISSKYKQWLDYWMQKLSLSIQIFQWRIFLFYYNAQQSF